MLLLSGPAAAAGVEEEGSAHAAAGGPRDAPPLYADPSTALFARYLGGMPHIPQTLGPETRITDPPHI